MGLFTSRSSRQKSKDLSLDLNKDQTPIHVDALVNNDKTHPQNTQDTPLSFLGSTIDNSIENDVMEIGSDFLKIARSNTAGVFSAQFWSDKLMDWAMKDQAFKIQFFRFIDTYPSLKTPEQIHDHLVDFMSQPGVTPPPGMELMTKAGGLAKGIFTSRMTKQITSMAQKFIVGSDAVSSIPTLKKLWNRNIAFTVDLLGESCVSERVADIYLGKYLDLVENLPASVADFKPNPVLESDHIGAVPRVNVSIKLSSLYWDLNPIDPEYSISALMERLAPILIAAGKNNVLVNFDIEQAEFKDLTLDIFESCCEKYDFPAGLALQAYLRSGPSDAQRIIDWAKNNGRQITVRLVKGAYWDYETINSKLRNWPVPVWSRKPETDACFEHMTSLFLANTPHDKDTGGVKLALGSHNVRSISYALATAKKLDLPNSAVELQMLHGMGDPLKAAATKLGLRLREYTPVGELLAGMAYFVRRLLENTSNESWLRAGFSDNAPVEVLLANPIALIKPDNIEDSPGFKQKDDGQVFNNEPNKDFSHVEIRNEFRKIVENTTCNKPQIINNQDEINNIVHSVFNAYKIWNKVDVQKRAQVLTDTANLMRNERTALASVIVHEAGMSWKDADIEVCDAIDFCEYYARLAVELIATVRSGTLMGELNHTGYASVGPALLITPWNKPLSALCAMAGVALVTGNSALVVPSSQVMGIASIWADLIGRSIKTIVKNVSADVQNVLRVLPVADNTVIQMLAANAGFRIIANSKPCVHYAEQTNNKSDSNTRWITYNFAASSIIVVDSSADMGEAVTGISNSAFGYQGQRFAACKTAIVVGDAYEMLVDTLVEAVGEMQAGDPVTQPANRIGPVIDEKVRSDFEVSVQSCIKNEKCQLTLAKSLHMNTDKAYVTPHIFTDVKPDSLLIQSQITGPLLSILKAESFDEAMHLTHTTGYHHTGVVYARKPSHIIQAQSSEQGMNVNSVFLNRSTCERGVTRQPLGIMAVNAVDFFVGLTGTSELLPFIQARLICENTMRHGFAPDIES